MASTSSSSVQPSQQLPQPPPPFSSFSTDFQFAFDPSLNPIFPEPPSVPPSAELFSASETTNLFGFLDNFNFDFDTEFLESANDSRRHGLTLQMPLLPHVHPHEAQFAPLSAMSFSSAGPSSLEQGQMNHMPRNALPTQRELPQDHRTRAVSLPKRKTPSPTPSESDSSRSQSQSHGTRNGSLSTHGASNGLGGAGSARNKPLLTTPQKRMNHIMSEQKRRNAIREGYAQLTTLLAPPGAAPGTGMPTRGRPRGSGNRNKGQCKGKSGVLLRAVEYIRWLEEGRDALQAEVMRIEACARSSLGPQEHLAATALCVS